MTAPRSPGYTALDVDVRHFEVVIAPDAVVHVDARLGQAASTMTEQNMAATTSRGMHLGLGVGGT